MSTTWPQINILSSRIQIPKTNVKDFERRVDVWNPAEVWRKQMNDFNVKRRLLDNTFWIFKNTLTQKFTAYRFNHFQLSSLTKQADWSSNWRHFAARFFKVFVNSWTEDLNWSEKKVTDDPPPGHLLVASVTINPSRESLRLALR